MRVSRTLDGGWRKWFAWFPVYCYNTKTWVLWEIVLKSKTREGTDYKQR